MHSFLLTNQVALIEVVIDVDKGKIVSIIDKKTQKL